MPTLEFKGKQHIYAHHLTVPYRPLVPDERKSVGDPTTDGNLIIHGDSLEGLKALLPRYAGRIRCIYIDPPYNTGNETWIYSDNTNSPHLQQWFDDQSPVDGEDLERHDKWLCMMWPRLQLLRELLSDDGIIFVSIDDNEQHHLRMIMDEIFGEENFLVVQTRKAMHTVRNSSKDFNLNVDYLLTYAKNKSWFGARKERYIRFLVDKSANYPNDDGDGRGPYKLDPLHARNPYHRYQFKFSNGVIWQAPSGRYPSYSQETLRKMELDNRIVFSGKDPQAKRYLREVQEGQPPNALLDPKVVGYNASGTRILRKIFGHGDAFPQPKPVELIKYIIDLLRDPSAIVLDSFAGSGTTAHAVLALNRDDGGSRRFILVECEDYATTVTAERVKRVITGTKDADDADLQSGLGGSFTFCELGEPLTVEGMLTGNALPPFSALAAWLLHTVTGVSSGTEQLGSMDQDGHFYSDKKRDYYLIYQPALDWLRSNEAALNQERASRISTQSRERERTAVVFAAAKYMSQRDLTTEYQITFCQIPYEIHRAS